jgi:hypothetical protein
LGNTTNIQSYAAGATSGLTAVRWSNDTIPPRLQVGKSRSATIGSYTIVQSGDQLGGLYFYGDDGTDLVSAAASIIAEVDGTPGVDDMPGRLIFSTTSDGSSNAAEVLRLDSEGRMSMRSSLSDKGSGTASSISGVTLTVGGTIAGTFGVGDRVTGTGVEPNTFITALGTGTGGAGTYTVSNSQTVASTTIRTVGGGLNTFRFTDTDTSASVNQPMGTIEWFGSDATTPGAGVKAYITSVSEGTSPDTAMVFGTSDNVASTQAVERMRIDSSGNVLVGVTTANANGGVLQLKSGITFPATAVAATDANTLDDYEEGTWTPVVTFTGGNGDLTTSEANGVYTKIGRLVQIAFNVEFSETTAATNLTITGVPFTSGTVRTAAGCFVDNMTTLTGAPVIQLGSIVTTITLIQTRTGAEAAITNLNTGTSSRVRGSLSYNI